LFCEDYEILGSEIVYLPVSPFLPPGYQYSHQSLIKHHCGMKLRRLEFDIELFILQQHLILLRNWMKQWKIIVNPAKSTKITFTTRRTICPQVSINNFPTPIKQEVKYLGLHLDKKWQMHIKAK
jgi:hypothetical protein